MVTCLAYCLDEEIWKAIEYLKEQVRVLKEQQEKDKRILLDDHQRIRLAAKASPDEFLYPTSLAFVGPSFFFVPFMVRREDGRLTNAISSVWHAAQRS